MTLIQVGCFFMKQRSAIVSSPEIIHIVYRYYDCIIKLLLLLSYWCTNIIIMMTIVTIMDDKQLVDSANTITFQHRAGKEKRCLAANASQGGDVQEKSRGQKQVIWLGVSSHSKNIRLKNIIPSYRLDENKHTQGGDTCLYRHFKAVVLISTCVLKMCVCSCLCERRPKRCREKLCMFGHSCSSAHETCSSDLIPHQNVTSKVKKK